MQSEGLKRRLAAVLMADVDGYSRLMRHSEDGTHAAVRNALSAAVTMLEQHRGQFISSAGDSLLARFDSAQDAVRCALELQIAMQNSAASDPADGRIAFRMGIHLGDVIEENDDIFGDSGEYCRPACSGKRNRVASASRDRCTMQSAARCRSISIHWEFAGSRTSTSRSRCFPRAVTADAAKNQEPAGKQRWRAAGSAPCSHAAHQSLRRFQAGVLQ